MPLSPAINGTEQRLDVLIRQLDMLGGAMAGILDVLRGLGQSQAPASSEDVAELREPSAPAAPKTMRKPSTTTRAKR